MSIREKIRLAYYLLGLAGVVLLSAKAGLGIVGAISAALAWTALVSLRD